MEKQPSEKQQPISSYEIEPISQEQLDKQTILDKLVEVTEEFGIDFDPGNIEELKQLLGENDSDFLSNLASFAWENGLDHEELFERLGIPIEYGS